jgi:hypothetical protein
MNMATPTPQDSRPLRSSHSIRSEREASLAERFGGFYWGSDFIGFAVAIFFTLVFFGIVSAIVGTVGYQMGAPVPKVGGPVSGTTQNLGLGGLIGGLVALFLAYLIGGYTAGRMARFDGVKNGIGVVIWTVVVAIILGILGAVLGNRFNVASQIHLNVNGATLTTAGVISVIVALIVAALGGSMGAGYHRRIDRQAMSVQ